MEMADNMIHTPPSFIQDMALQPPDTVPLHEWLWGADDAAHERHGRHALSTAKSPFICGLTGEERTARDVQAQIETLAAALGKELGMEVNEGNDLDKVIGVFSLNTMDTYTTYWAIHRLNGIAGLIATSYTVTELTGQLAAMKCKALVTCAELLPKALEAAAAAGIPREKIYLLEVSEKEKGAAAEAKKTEGLKTIRGLIEEGQHLEKLERVRWEEGQGKRQTAFFSTSSGTSGTPKIIKIPHHAVIANTLQWVAWQRNFEAPVAEAVLAVLPFSQSYSTVLIGHMCLYRGDSAIVLPHFDVADVCNAIQTHSISTLWTVPPMLVAMLRAPHITSSYTLTSVRTTIVTATNLTLETIQDFQKLLPNSRVCQGYGQTESVVAVCFQNGADWMLGSVGHLFPGVQARLIDGEGRDVNGRLGVAGELVLKAPGRMLGYLDNEEATKEAFTEDGWMRTGDLMEFRLSEKGNENLFMIDRVKQVIKVRGIQVAPAELEGILSTSPYVSDMCVVGILSETAGELPLAYIVLSPEGKTLEAQDDGPATLRVHITEFMADKVADFKRLAGGIEFVEALPKTATGKTRRGEVKGWAKALYEEQKAQQKRERDEEEREVNGKVPAPAVVLQTMEFGSDEDDSDDE